MAKRKYYLSEPQDQQLLPFLLKKFPDKFRILGKKVWLLLNLFKPLAGDFPGGVRAGGGARQAPVPGALRPPRLLRPQGPLHPTPLHSTLLHCSLSFPSSSPNPPTQADEYGVYFFDPRYYEGTEPFHAALRLACPNQVLSVLRSSLPSSLLIPLLLHLLRRCGAPWCRATSTPRG